MVGEACPGEGPGPAIHVFLDAGSKDVDGGAKMLWGWAVAAACILPVVQNL